MSYLGKIQSDQCRERRPCDSSATCRCGCEQPVAPGRKFLNQQHYDRSKGPSPAKAEQVIKAFRAGVPKAQLAREYGVALSTVKRLLRKKIGDV